MTDPTPLPELPAKRPYEAPVLSVHGDVQTLTLKTGQTPEAEGGGSFTPDGGAVENVTKG
jgi:hypothetical protein